MKCQCHRCKGMFVRLDRHQRRKHPCPDRRTPTEKYLTHTLIQRAELPVFSLRELCDAARKP